MKSNKQPRTPWGRIVGIFIWLVFILLVVFTISNLLLDPTKELNPSDATRQVEVASVTETRLTEETNIPTDTPTSDSSSLSLIQTAEAQTLEAQMIELSLTAQSNQQVIAQTGTAQSYNFSLTLTGVAVDVSLTEAWLTANPPTATSTYTLTPTPTFTLTVTPTESFTPTPTISTATPTATEDISISQTIEAQNLTVTHEHIVASLQTQQTGDTSRSETQMAVSIPVTNMPDPFITQTPLTPDILNVTQTSSLAGCPARVKFGVVAPVYTAPVEIAPVETTLSQQAGVNILSQPGLLLLPVEYLGTNEQSMIGWINVSQIEFDPTDICIQSLPTPAELLVSQKEFSSPKLLINDIFSIPGASPYTLIDSLGDDVYGSLAETVAPTDEHLRLRVVVPSPSNRILFTTLPYKGVYERGFNEPVTDFHWIGVFTRENSTLDARVGIRFTLETVSDETPIYYEILTGVIAHEISDCGIMYREALGVREDNPFEDSDRNWNLDDSTCNSVQDESLEVWTEGNEVLVRLNGGNIVSFQLNEAFEDQPGRIQIVAQNAIVNFKFILSAGQ